MIADGLFDFRIAVPTGDLDGDFHDKFGIFRDAFQNVVAFHGSPNDGEPERLSFPAETNLPKREGAVIGGAGSLRDACRIRRT
jgi:hypothetical protein